MSNDTDALIDAIQRIAWAENRYQTSFLNAARKRGTLPAETGRGGSTEPDCCNADNQGSTNDGSNKTNAGEIPDDGDLGDHLEQLCGLNDCATGQPVCVNFSGTFEAPEGWESLDDPPVYDEYWEIGSSGCQSCGISPRAWGKKGASLDEVYQIEIAAMYAWAEEQYKSGSWSVTYGPSLVTCEEGIKYGISMGTNGIGKGSGLYFSSCTDASFNLRSGEYTPAAWPADNIPQIALIDGSFVTHKNDPDGADYLYPKNDLTLCDSAGKQMRVVGDKMGGFMTIPTDPATGEPLAGAVISRYNTNGDRIGTIGADEVPIYELPPLTE